MQKRIYIGMETIFWDVGGGRCQACSGHEEVADFPMQFHENLLTGEGASSHRLSIPEPKDSERAAEGNIDYSEMPELEEPES